MIPCSYAANRSGLIHGLLALTSVFAPASVHGQSPSFVSFNADTQLGYCVTTSPDGRHVYFGGIYTMAVFERQGSDSLQTIQLLNNDHLGVTGILHIIDIVVSPDGNYVYAVDPLARAVHIFARNTLTGQITKRESLPDSVFAGVHGIPADESGYKSFIPPDGLQLYWLYSPYRYFPGNVLAVFARDIVTGRLNKIQTIRNGDSALGGHRVPNAITMSANGKFFY